MTITDLPFDIHVTILQHLQRTGQEGVKTLARCLRVNSTLHAAASSSTLWKGFYRARYIHFREAEEVARIESCSGNYRLLYATRRALDQEVLSLLHQIIYDRESRQAHVNEIANLSWDAWDALNDVADCCLPSAVSREKKVSTEEAKPLAITRRYWAKRLLQIIGRRYAARLWNELLRHDPDIDTELCERSLSAISAFFGVSPYVIERAFDDLAGDCRVYLNMRNLTLVQQDPRYDPLALCSMICTFMQEQGFKAVGSERFRVVGNSLPHHYLFKSRATIPISLVHVFVAIARRLGIPASHANIPSRILSRVAFPNSKIEDFYVDVYEGDVLTHTEMSTLVPQLAGMSFDQFEATILQTPSFAMITRAMRNIMCCNPLDGVVSDRTAMYCAQFPVVLIRPQTSIHVLSSIDDPALEVGAFLLPTVMPLLLPEERESFHLICQAVLREDEATSGVINQRSLLRTEVKYRIGMFFKHAKYDYTGLIYGWDPECAAADQWVRAMGVASLPRGKDQPFYHVLRLEGSETYVAEENIIPTQPTEEIVRKFFENHSSFGRYFSDIEFVKQRNHSDGISDEEGEPIIRAQSLGRMVPSPEWIGKYPEDYRADQPYEYFVVDI